MCSKIAGLGERSGNVIPSMQNTPSLGSSPKSPPYACRVVPLGSRWTSPWSRHSQMNPPWSPGVDSIASQYSASVPLLLPIAWLNSHITSGCRWAPLVAWATSAAIGGYIGQVRSLTRWSLDQSRRIAPS